ncbi:ISL3 family transposase [Staphylococcus caeli]|uniref:IS1181 transposase n=1 Tax=Staphylococcus caeli TaxID=2201815 RepID=A0A1D4NQD9_9STAP|nr:ISL3 family transposase [Staphylococcus caeli]AWM30244.1 IS1181 transposase [Staphylococcus caeli]SCT10046.1 transposase for ISSps1 [Staphylococcus caeli]SCT12937.1 transposase for ISSps1 [Staphylococcus caeli]
MPYPYNKTNHFGLKVNHLHFINQTPKEMYYKCIKTLFYSAVLTYDAIACECCGIKNGKRHTLIYMGEIIYKPAYLELYKQRFYCKACGETFTAKTPFVQPKSTISNPVKLAIAEKVSEARSEKAIAHDLLISPSTVHRQIKLIAQQVKPKLSDTLPNHLSFDEFKSTKDVEGAMSFIYCDGETHEILDVLPDRRKSALESYFNRFSLKTRKRVKTISVDMYKPYIELIKKLFPNAKIIIDRFHIVQAINREINRCRVSVMNQKCSNNRPEYNKLKRYWRLFVKNPNHLNATHYHPFRLFKSWQSTYSALQYLLTLDDKLEVTYRMGHQMLNALRMNNPKRFKEFLNKAKNEDIFEGLKRIIKTFIEYLPYIENTMDHRNFTNGPIEGIINKIKLIKRNAYGYRNFINLRNRILIISRLFVSEHKKYIKQQNRVA